MSFSLFIHFLLLASLNKKFVDIEYFRVFLFFLQKSLQWRPQTFRLLLNKLLSFKWDNSRSLLHLLIYFFICVAWAWRGSCVPWCMCGGQRISYRNHFSPSTVLVLGRKLRSLGLAASVFTHWAISPALKQPWQTTPTLAMPTGSHL